MRIGDPRYCWFASNEISKIQFVIAISYSKMTQSNDDKGSWIM